MSGEQERLPLAETIPRWVVAEHHARYAFAATFVRHRVVVDCACGNGIGVREFASHGSSRIVAIDASPEALHAAKESRPPSRTVHFLLGDATMLPLSSHSADIVISLETLEHLAYGERFLDEARRVMKPAGTFICSTPNRLVTHPGAPLSVRPINRFHVQEYSVEEFRSLLADRFRQVQLYGQNPQPRSQRRVVGLVGRVLPRRWTARLNQLLKLRRFIWYDPSLSVVVPVAADLDYEYVVAVCREPIDG